MNSMRNTSIKIQKTLNYNLLERVIRDGYGMRGKSKWIAEAIEKFLEIKNYPYLVNIAVEVSNLEEIISIRLPQDLFQRIEEAVITTRKEYPAMEAVQSHLIRSSIMQRLIRE
jgi:metal-responsive CopG/Arc/MetJ family transcriptional regulator